MNKKKKKDFWSWNFSDEEIKIHLKEYDSTKFSKSYRGEAILLLSLSFLVTIVFAGIFESVREYIAVEDAIITFIVYLPFLIFVYLGHRWAIFIVLIFWSLDNIAAIFMSIDAGIKPIGPIIWFLIVTPSLYKALLIENARKKAKKYAKAIDSNTKNQDGESVFCSKCGMKNVLKANFCKGCGNKILK